MKNLTYLYNSETKDLISTDSVDFVEVLKQEGYAIVDEPFYAVLLNKETYTYRLLELKTLLLETDWKVIVNSELIQAGLPLKYPNLHEERQAWRDEINKLEEEIILATNS